MFVASNSLCVALGVRVREIEGEKEPERERERARERQRERETYLTVPTGHVTFVVTRLGPDGFLLGDPPVQGPLPPRSARPAAPEPTPSPLAQVRATRGVVWDVCGG